MKPIKGEQKKKESVCEVEKEYSNEHLWALTEELARFGQMTFRLTCTARNVKMTPALFLVVHS